MKSLIIGMGEVGKGLAQVLRPHHEVECYDITYAQDGTLAKVTFDVIHICFPWSTQFVNNVLNYVGQLSPSLCIIHSTVPVGTTRYISEAGPAQCEFVHSPIHGKHPNLSLGIRTFTKYIGALTEKAAIAAQRYFMGTGVECYRVDTPETSEMSKLLCTTQTAIGILVEKEIKRLCDEYGANFKDVYERWNGQYNQGYDDIGMPWFRRPVYAHMDGPLGGHCLRQNVELLPDTWLKSLVQTIDDRERAPYGVKPIDPTVWEKCVLPPEGALGQRSMQLGPIQEMAASYGVPKHIREDDEQAPMIEHRDAAGKLMGWSKDGNGLGYKANVNYLRGE